MLEAIIHNELENDQERIKKLARLPLLP
ncbi:hypothetical protein OL548_15385 [Lysinibacillus sp. MHQ-1]|nr:hypothetical protein OL548_15385 [Lysinibacillus sp. MHQ-1]